MDYVGLRHDLIAKMEERKSHLRQLERDEERRVEAMFQLGNETYKTEYYKDLFALDHKLQTYKRQDILLDNDDYRRKQKLISLIDKRKDLRKKEDILYENY